MQVRVSPRVRDVRPLRELVSGPIATVVTAEGELAAYGTAGDRTVAIVGVDPALVIELTGATEAQTLALLDELGTGLDPARRRWYRYDPPSQWFGVRRHAASVFLAPATSGVLHVFDARPFLPSDAERFERCLTLGMPPGFSSATPGTTTPLRSRHGLDGHLHVVAGTRANRPVTRLVATLADDRYCYAAHFEGVADHIAIVTAVLESIRPLPIGASSPAELVF